VRESAQNTAGELTAKVKAVPKRAKLLALAILVLIAAFIVFYIIGSSLTSPENVARGYFISKTSGDWEKMYSFLSLEDSEFINQENFVKMMENESKVDVANYEISESMYAPSGLDWIKMYTVEYMVRGESHIRTEIITLVLQNDKKLLLFDNYKVVSDDFMTSSFMVTIPKDSIVYLNDIELTHTIAETPDDLNLATETFIVPKLFSKEYELRINHSVYGEYANVIHVNEHSSVYSVSSSMLELPMDAISAKDKNDTSINEESEHDRRDDLIGVWRGTYQSPSGRVHGLEIMAYEIQEDYQAAINFFAGPNSGTATDFPRYLASIVFNEETGEFVITYTSALHLPQGWFATGTMHLTLHENELLGYFTGGENSLFLTRIQ
jgi:hypothetical protein